MSSRELELKIAQLQSKNETLLEARRASSKRIRELVSSRDALKQKYRQSKVKAKALKRRVKMLGSGNGAPIYRHKYDSVTVNLCVSIYILGGCSLRGVVRILEYQRFFLGIEMDQVPSKSSIENWVQKCGHHVYGHPDMARYSKGYGLIVDECMVIGQQRMLSILAISSDKEEPGALGLCQAEVVLLQTKASWSGADISESLQKVAEKLGTMPSYIISDGGSNLVKGIRDSAAIRLCDCGHEIARLTEQVYKDDERLKAFCSTAGQTKFKEVMKDTGYLTAPKQRSIARFMNLACLVDWGSKIIDNIGSFSEKEQCAYRCIKDHKGVIEELSEVFSVSHQILKVLKQEGLSYATVEKCNSICADFLQKTTGQPFDWATKIVLYLDLEKAKLPDNKTTWHASSDIIESLFGRFKARKADNALYGVTPFVLMLPLMTRVAPDKPVINIDFKEALEGTFMSDLGLWRNENLIENQVIRRKMALKE